MKLYTIECVSIGEYDPEVNTEVFTTEEARDARFNQLVLNHNNMIQDTYHIDLHKPTDWEPSFYYVWNSDYLEFYDKTEIGFHHDVYCKNNVILQEDK